jgi:hypothetical protein
LILVGCIDREILNRIFPSAATDEVVITEERIEHIKNRHPGVYERYHSYMRSIVECPAFVLEDDRPNTVAMLGVFAEAGKQFMLILRLHTSDDPEEHKNSIITFMRLSQKRCKEYVANKKVLYIRE